MVSSNEQAAPLSTSNNLDYCLHEVNHWPWMVSFLFFSFDFGFSIPRRFLFFSFLSLDFILQFVLRHENLALRLLSLFVYTFTLSFLGFFCNFSPVYYFRTFWPSTMSQDVHNCFSFFFNVSKTFLALQCCMGYLCEELSVDITGRLLFLLFTCTEHGGMTAYAIRNDSIGSISYNLFVSFDICTIPYPA